MEPSKFSSTQTKVKREFMLKAMEVAKKAAKRGDYAIGAVIVKDDQIVSVGNESLKSVNDPVNGHAEIDAIRKACKKLNQPYLEGCVLYSTHEPCPMCASAAVWAKIDTIVFSVSREDMIKQMERGTSGKFSWRQIRISCKEVLKKGTPKIDLVPGFLREEGLKLFDLAQ